MAVYEAHTHPGGCAHSFPIKARTSKGKNNLQKATYNFDSGPTIILGCQSEPYNPLRQVFNMLGAESEIDWIGWDRWGMATEDGKWHFQLGNDHFENGPLKRFGGENAVSEFRNLREECAPLTTGAANIPTKALRGDGFKLLPLLPYMSELQKVIPYADILNGNFKPFMDKHISDPWLRSWLDALAFSLSGLPAAETGAAAMAYTIYDLHREGASLDYPTGGMGKIAETFVNVIERTGGRVYFNSPVTNIRVSQGSKEARAEGISLSDGSFIRAKRGIICNAPIWSLPSLLKSDLDKLSADQRRFFMEEAANKNFTKSFMHLHLGLDSNGLDLSKFEPHYTVMDQGLHTADPCADRNMVAVSNPSVLDSSLVDTEDKIIVHAYSAGNEDYGRWGKYKNDRNSEEYKKFKSQDSKFLYEAVSRSLGISVVEIKERAEVSLEGSPLTHERFLRRYRGTYGSAWGAMQGMLKSFSLTIFIISYIINFRRTIDPIERTLFSWRLYLPWDRSSSCCIIRCECSEHSCHCRSTYDRSYEINTILNKNI